MGTIDETIKQDMYYLTLGIGKAIKVKYVSIYGGLEIPFIHYGQFSHVQTDIITQPGQVETGGGSVTLPGGYSIGIGAFAGLDFFLLKKISVGVEFSIAYSYSKTGGIEPVYTWGSGTNNFNSVNVYTNSREQFYFSVIRPFLNISYHL